MGMCQGCTKRYKVDLIVTDDIWDKIRPSHKEEDAGMLCPECIIQRIDDGEHGCFHLMLDKDFDELSLDVRNKHRIWDI